MAELTEWFPSRIVTLARTLQKAAKYRHSRQSVKFYSKKLDFRSFLHSWPPDRSRNFLLISR